MRLLNENSVTSDRLKDCQNTLELLAKLEIDDPMTDMRKLKRMLTVIDEIDTLRRETWNKEKFGECDNICSDDVPF